MRSANSFLGLPDRHGFERAAGARPTRRNWTLRRELGLLSDVREAHRRRRSRRQAHRQRRQHALLPDGGPAPPAGHNGSARSDPRAWEQVLGELRILIVHAGGDSRRLPAYGPCGKIFIPVPGENDSAVCLSLFDRQLPTYLALPEPTQGRGQVVITSGDVLLRFDPTQVRFTNEGVTGLACYAQPEQASRHGVFCCGQDDEVRLYLQKPSIAEQTGQGRHRRLRPVLSRHRRDALRRGHGGPAPAALRCPAEHKARLAFAGQRGPGRHGARTRLLSRNLLRHGSAGQHGAPHPVGPGERLEVDRGRCWANCSGLSRPSRSTCSCSRTASSWISARTGVSSTAARACSRRIAASRTCRPVWTSTTRSPPAARFRARRVGSKAAGFTSPLTLGGSNVVVGVDDRRAAVPAGGGVPGRDRRTRRDEAGTCGLSAATASTTPSRSRRTRGPSSAARRLLAWLAAMSASKRGGRVECRRGGQGPHDLERAALPGGDRARASIGSGCGCSIRPVPPTASVRRGGPRTATASNRSSPWPTTRASTSAAARFGRRWSAARCNGPSGRRAACPPASWPR